MTVKFKVRKASRFAKETGAPIKVIKDLNDKWAVVRYGFNPRIESLHSKRQTAKKALEKRLKRLNKTKTKTKITKRRSSKK